MVMMKILILTNNSGGLYKFRRELIATLLQDHTVTAATPFDEETDALIALGTELIETPLDRRGIDPVKDGKLYRTYRRLVKKEKADMVITYTIKPNIYGGIVCRRLKIPYAVNITGLGTAFQRSGLLKALVVRLYKIALRDAKVVFFENVGNLQTFLDAKIVAAEQTCLLNGAGVDLEQFRPLPYPTGAETRFLFVGRVMREKGVNELFMAMEKLRGDGLAVHLDVLGGYEEDYREIVSRGECDGWLTYHGYQSDVRPFIKASHCFVLPSWHEGMANTNLECAACGRPLITSNIFGCKEAVIDGESGYLCKPKDADDLYTQMKRFCALSDEERRRMGERGRVHMEQHFDKKAVVEKTVEQIEK